MIAALALLRTQHPAEDEEPGGDEEPGHDSWEDGGGAIVVKSIGDGEGHGYESAL